MTRSGAFNHEFVEHIPEKLKDGIVYISMPFATAAHRCACGCGTEVVTPFTPTDWEMTFDGETVSLSPSIGNWNFECESHYWIERGRVRWARRWSRDEIDEGRDRDRRARERYRQRPAVQDDLAEAPPHGRPGLMQRFVASLRRRGR